MAERRLDTDITIIGGGGAGVAAALEAGEAGAAMVLVEQDETLGGTAATLGGGFIVGTPLQESQGIHDTPDLAFEDWVTWGQGAADEAWARYYIEHTLLTDHGRVCGVRATDVQSGDNLDMILEARPELRAFKVMEGSGRGATGSGHALIRELGGYFTHMEHLWFYVYATPDHRDPRGRRGLVFRLTPGYLWVNQQGRRFHDQSRAGDASATPALLRQTPPHAWAILDTPMTAKMEVADPYYRDGDKVRRDALEELARMIEVDVPTFLGQVQDYNTAFDAGLDQEPAFGKALGQSQKFDTPPYYAIQLFPLARKNFGGVKTDLRCRVLNRSFEPIPGLYAAGEVAGMAGGHINGAAGLEGTMLGPAIFSGRVAGGWAAHEAGFGSGFIGKANRPA